MEETLNVIFVRVNLGTFHPLEARPSMLPIQNKVNYVFLDIEKSELQYKRIELTEKEYSTIELYFFYKFYKEIADNYLSKLSSKFEKLKKSEIKSVQTMLISKKELDKFNKLHDDSLTGIATLKQNKDAKEFADNLGIKYSNSML